MMVLSEKDPNYRRCAISLMDNIADPDIQFDGQGVCSYYHEYLRKEKEMVFTGEAGAEKLRQTAEMIRESGRGRKYDCITGVSGGVDSTYVALTAKRLGLNPLIVHFDNGWNSETAVKNIENIVSKLGFDLYTLVVDWNEFKDIQLAYIRASVVDIEAITDHAIIATMYKLAVEHNIRYVLSGTNIVTEATLPRHWIYSKTDHVNLLDIHRQYGTLPLKTFPLFDFPLKKKVQLRKISGISPLNYLPYIKSEIKQTIATELGWRDYGGKHHESVFTRFYQSYILPEKFHIDKRKAHLSNLIYSGQITLAEAMQEMEKPIYDPEQLASDKDFVIKKFGFSEQQFADIMKQPRREHTEFKTERSIWDTYTLLKPFKKFRQSISR